MNGRLGVRTIPTVIFIVAFFLSPAGSRSETTPENRQESIRAITIFIRPSNSVIA